MRYRQIRVAAVMLVVTVLVKKRWGRLKAPCRMDQSAVKGVIHRSGVLCVCFSEGTLEFVEVSEKNRIKHNIGTIRFL